MDSQPLQTQSGSLATPSISAAFRFRRGRVADLEHCIALLPSGFQASLDIRERLTALWGALLVREAHSFAVIEDLERPYPECIEAFGLSVFVSDSFVSAFEASPRPQLAAFVYDRMVAGDPVLLSAEDLASYNSTTGINILVLHFGLRNHDLSDPRSAQAVAAGAAAFYFFHGGYRVKAILNEVFGLQSADFLARGGFRLVHDYQKENPEAFKCSDERCRPFLFMLRREWAEPSAVNILSQLFVTPSPRIGFSQSEQRVLECALLNETDQVIASDLGISEDAVKKTWRKIFERVSRRAPFLLPSEKEGVAGRGKEKRRGLLEYLRLHLEELRPTVRLVSKNG